MRAYRIFLLNTGGEIVSEREMYCADDAEARARAKAQANSEEHAVELWQDAQFLRRIDPVNASAY